MAFKLSNPPYSCDNTPIYNVDLENGVLGKAQNNGSILINKNIKDPKRGDLDYDDDCVYWKGECWPRSKMKEGAKNLPWEAEAYKKNK